MNRVGLAVRGWLIVACLLSIGIGIGLANWQLVSVGIIILLVLFGWAMDRSKPKRDVSYIRVARIRRRQRQRVVKVGEEEDHSLWLVAKERLADKPKGCPHCGNVEYVGMIFSPPNGILEPTHHCRNCNATWA